MAPPLLKARHHHRMFIQKIFHIHQSVDETKSRLSNLQIYRRHLEGFKKAIVTADGVAQFDGVTSNGFHAHAVVVELPTEEPNQVLFSSTAGNVELAGLLEFFPVKDDLTEVQLTLEYAIKSPVHSVLDAVTASMERFISKGIANLAAAVNGSPNVAVPSCKSSPARFLAHLPDFAH